MSNHVHQTSALCEFLKIFTISLKIFNLINENYDYYYIIKFGYLLYSYPKKY